jgi:hypothetical protein
MIGKLVARLKRVQMTTILRISAAPYPFPDVFCLLIELPGY